MGVEAPAQRRLPGLDAAKALAIVGVVLIHAAPDEASPYHRHVVDGLARLAVPCFLVVTGLLAGLKASSRRRMRSYALEFVRLHLIYGLFYWAVSLARDGCPETWTLKTALLHFGEASYPGQYYFLILIQSFALAWLLPERLWRTTGAVVFWGAVAAAGVAWLRISAGTARPDSSAELVAYRIATSPNGAWLWFYFFALGATLGARRRRGLQPSPQTGAAWVLAGILVASLGLADWPEWYLATRLPYARAPIYAGATLLALGLPALATVRAPDPLLRLGRESFTVFVLNPALLMLLAGLFGAAASPAGSWVRTAATLVVAVALARPLRRFAPFAVA